jgi:hypothetical protein
MASSRVAILARLSLSPPILSSSSSSSSFPWGCYCRTGGDRGDRGGGGHGDGILVTTWFWFHNPHRNPYRGFPWMRFLLWKWSPSFVFLQQLLLLLAMESAVTDAALTILHDEKFLSNCRVENEIGFFLVAPLQEVSLKAFWW